METVSNVVISQKFRTMEKTVLQIHVAVVNMFSKMVLVQFATTNNITLVIISAKNVQKITVVNRTVNVKSHAQHLKEGC